MNRRLFTITLATLFVILIGSGPQTVFPQALLTTVYVDQDNTGAKDGTVDYPYPTISEGISIVSNGGTVIVAPGTYLENLTISKSLTLRGSGLDVTTIDGGQGGSTIAITQNGLDVTIEHFKITGGTGAVATGAGIEGTAGSSIHVRWNWFTGNGNHGVISHDADDIERNLFTNNGDGLGAYYAIWATTGSTANIHNNTIRRTTNGDTATNRVGVGIAIGDGNYGAAPDIRNNIVYNVFRLFGIWRGKATYSMLQLGKSAIALKVKVKALEKSCDPENAIATPLDRFDLIVQAFHETTAETVHKVVDDFTQPVVECRQEFIETI